MGERVGLARPCSRDDKQRGGEHAFAVLDAVFDSSSLFGIEFLKVRRGHRLLITLARRVPPSYAAALLSRRPLMFNADVVSVRVLMQEQK
jgi:hypothetical protein